MQVWCWSNAETYQSIHIKSVKTVFRSAVSRICKLLYSRNDKLNIWYFSECLTWIFDREDRIKEDKFVLPFAYWEAGVTAYLKGNLEKAHGLWEEASRISGYEFELRWVIVLYLSKAILTFFCRVQPLTNCFLYSIRQTRFQVTFRTNEIERSNG